MKRELPSAYNAKDYEAAIYRKWEKGGFFKPGKKGKPFSIIMPPPNANGSLHIGHAFEVALHDTLIRFWRMRGRRTLWLPGADHAGFETQVVYNKKLEKEGRNFFQIPREELYKEILNFTLENKKTMEGQLRKLGASCDWSRNTFTLDRKIIKTVYATFKQLYDDGLVYRENRLVNWCIKHQTTLSDLEVKHEDQIDSLYYINYGPLTVATVRPEPIFADVAVAVHPKDKRYKHLIGTMARIPLIDKEIPIIADESVDPEFGTGAVKVTPSVDHNDFELAKKHNLPIIQIIDQFGKLTDPAPEKYRGMKVREAREAIAVDIQEAGLMEKVDDQYLHAISACYKCKTVLEPRLLPQWYVAMTRKSKSGGQSLRDGAVKAVKAGEIKFVPKRMEKTFMNWMKDLRDWNISRQIVWGIRIPAWYKGDRVHIGETPPEKEGWIQETDVFDTWFSSGQWPFATLGYPNGKDFETFYPTDVMGPAYEIIFFWVARMIMLGVYRTGNIPFKTVFLHGLVRDKERQKMSKSKGNVIDPLGVVEVYGTDAMRMALIAGTAPGNDPTISEEKIRGYRNFANKIWNASRFVLMNCDDVKDVSLRAPRSVAKQSREDKKALKDLDTVVKKVTDHFEKFGLHNAGETLYHYIWHEFADKVIERQKEKLSSPNDRKEAQALLLHILATILKLLHPFMPYVTEAIWTEMPIKNKKLLIVTPWPR